MSAGLTIRRAKQGDAAFLPAVEKSAARAFGSVPGLEWVVDDDPWPEEHYASWLEKETSWVAENPDGTIVAFLAAEIFGNELHIWELSVHADGQAQGVGRRLMETAEQFACDADLAGLTLTTFRNLRFNEHFYQKIGFETLPDEDVSDRLSTVLDRENEEGWPRSIRCAMRKRL